MYHRNHHDVGGDRGVHAAVERSVRAGGTGVCASAETLRAAAKWTSRLGRPTDTTVPIIWDDSRRELQSVPTSSGGPHLSVVQGGAASLAVFCTNCYDGGAVGLGNPFSVNWFSTGVPPLIAVSFNPTTTSGNAATSMTVAASFAAQPGNSQFTYYVCRQDIPDVCSDYTVLDPTVIGFSTVPTGSQIPPAIWNQANLDRCQPDSGQLGNGCAIAVNKVLLKVMGHTIPASDTDNSYICHNPSQPRAHHCNHAWVPDVIEWGLANGYLQQVSEQDARQGQPRQGRSARMRR